MAFLDIPNVSIKGLSACVPNQIDLIPQIYKWDGVNQFMESTGIKERRRVNDQTTASDLCIDAAASLIIELGWKREEIEAVVFVTQTPDYRLPATSCIIQDKLNLPNSCFCLDISLGCSGWVYGLSVITSLMQSGNIKKGLLLAGDTLTKIISPEDKSTFPLFGDAGTATALEYEEGAKGFKFDMHSDGKGFETIIVREGGFRNEVTPPLHTDQTGDEISNGQFLFLDGMNVFSFGINKAPKSVKTLATHFDLDITNVDIFAFHQANKMMNEMIRKKLKLDSSKVPSSLESFANTSAASIPLTLVTQEAKRLRNDILTHIACGFGVGLSWGSVWFETDKIKVPNLRIYKD